MMFPANVISLAGICYIKNTALILEDKSKVTKKYNYRILDWRIGLVHDYSWFIIIHNSI